MTLSALWILCQTVSFALPALPNFLELDMPPGPAWEVLGMRVAGLLRFESFGREVSPLVSVEYRIQIQMQ